MTGGWGTRKRRPSNDPERPPKGPGSGTLPKGPASVSGANPERVQIVVCVSCCGDHEGCSKEGS
jgi:hypothetical protein